MKCLVGLILVMALWTSPAYAAELKRNILDPAYQHDKWGTSSSGIIKEFRAYTSSFDSGDDNNKDGLSDAWGVPVWVAYEVKKTQDKCIKTYDRPAKWITDASLFKQGLMPNDESYAYPSNFTKKCKDWFSRGHLAMKMLVERLGEEAGWNSHTFYNAVPQRQLFNAGIWLDLENITAIWAQEYGSVWVITGPIFADKLPHAHLGEADEFPVAIPDALFKIVVKEGANPERPDVLAFIYPQVGAGYYRGKPFDHSRYMTTVDEIEKLTGVDFLVRLPKNNEREIEANEVRVLWPADPKKFIKACSTKYND